MLVVVFVLLSCDGHVGEVAAVSAMGAVTRVTGMLLLKH